MSEVFHPLSLGEKVLGKGIDIDVACVLWICFCDELLLLVPIERQSVAGKEAAKIFGSDNTRVVRGQRLHRFCQGSSCVKGYFFPVTQRKNHARRNICSRVNF